MQNYTNKALAGVLVLASVLALIPSAQAATAFGAVVGATDFDTTYALTAGPIAGAFNFFDDDGDTVVDLDEPVYYSAGAAVASLDLRVSVDGFTAGTQVRGTDSDVGLAVAGAFAALIADLDSSGGFTSGDAAYGAVLLGQDGRNDVSALGFLAAAAGQETVPVSLGS